ncbi:MAG: hypothetical protein ACJ72D_24595, partial [Marmoricola sp.]
MRGTLRLVFVAFVSIAVVAALVVNTRSGGGSGSGQADELKKDYAVNVANANKKPGDNTVYNADGTHAHDPGAPPHNDNDPKTKNSVSRSAPTTDSDTADPTTPAQAARSMDAAAQQRNQKEPKLRNVAIDPAQPTVPTNRYNLFNACYGLKSIASGKYLKGLSFATTTLAGSSPLFFKPTALGHYMLYTTSKTYLSGGKANLVIATKPGPAVDWIVTQAGTGSFRLFRVGSGYLQASTGTLKLGTFAASPNDRTQFTPYKRTGC